MTKSYLVVGEICDPNMYFLWGRNEPFGRLDDPRPPELGDYIMITRDSWFVLTNKFEKNLVEGMIQFWERYTCWRRHTFYLK